MSRRSRGDRIDRRKRLHQERRVTCVRFDKDSEGVKPRRSRKRHYEAHAREFQGEQAKVFFQLVWSSHSVSRSLSLTETEKEAATNCTNDTNETRIISWHSCHSCNSWLIPCRRSEWPVAFDPEREAEQLTIRRKDHIAMIVEAQADQ